MTRSSFLFIIEIPLCTFFKSSRYYFQRNFSFLYLAQGDSFYFYNVKRYTVRSICIQATICTGEILYSFYTIRNNCE